MSDLRQPTARHDSGSPARSHTDAPGAPVVSTGRRGSHATRRGQGFSWVIGWTLLGSLLPGAGLLAAGRRRAGGFLLGLVGAGVLAVGRLALDGSLAERLQALVIQPERLVTVTVAIGAVAVLWVLSIVVTHAQLRRYAELGTGQRLFSTLVVLALVVAVAMPAYQAGRYALIGRDLVDTVFQENVDAETSTALASSEKADPWAGVSRVNVLLIGSDAGEDRIGIRPDTMIVASVDTTTGNTVLFSLPRNLENVPFPSGTPGRNKWPDGFNCGDECLLNAIWTWAEQEGSGYDKFRNPGLAATEDAIEGAIGLKIDTYAMLNLKGFAEFVNAIGGLTVNVRERLPIGGDSNPLSPIYHVATGGWIEIGENQHLDGYHALWFARSRWASDDYHRMQRQRCVIAAFVDQVDPVTVALQFPALAKAAKRNITTGIPIGDLDAWVELSKRVQGGKVTSLPFTREVVDVARPDFDKVHELVERALAASERTTPAGEATASPRPDASSSPNGPKSTPKAGSTPKTEPSAKPANPNKAQDVNAVC
ncbi:LCP family protein [Kineosporia succinea]|uniref:LCP family protein required for cell wall assembly n=1 Tax=Kineosporia succinea TaxID=84632 RepID=A0ABT9P0I5_9ACTN|nr:LCP family protein [Kineosporia succinea]MDP9826189.1 LCP family protein required for cell wall assembly [Kineosporia succinea]